MHPEFEGKKFDPQNPHKNLGVVVACVCDYSAEVLGSRGILGALGLTSLAKDPGQGKTIIKIKWTTIPNSCHLALTCLCTHMCTHTCKAHTDTHTNCSFTHHGYDSSTKQMQLSLCLRWGY